MIIQFFNHTSTSVLRGDVTGAADVSCSKNPEDCQEGPHVDDQTRLHIVCRDHWAYIVILLPRLSLWSPEPGIIPTPTLPWLLYRSVQRGGKISHLEINMSNQ